MKMNLAIVHDGLATSGGRGGAEWVLTVLHEMFPQAPIYTTVYNKDRMPEYFREFDIRTSFIQRFPWVRRNIKPIYHSCRPLLSNLICAAMMWC